MKRKALLIAAAALMCLPLFAQNPISPMGVYIADPSARVYDGHLYIYGSLDVTGKTYCSPFHHVMETTDMLTWNLHRDAFASMGKTDGISYNDEPLYAPDGAYRNGTYYIYYCQPGQNEGVAVSSSPTGPFVDGVDIDGPTGIDPCVFIDDDGQAYYFWGQFSAKGAKMNKDMKSIDKSSIVDGIVTEQEHFFHEGSFVFKRDGWYYFVYADISRKGAPTCIGYSMSRNIFGPYEYKGVIVDNAGSDPMVWNNHGSVAELNGQWYVFYHRATHYSQTFRKACVEPITFNEDGTINEVKMTSQGAGKPLDAFSQIDAARACQFTGNAHIRRVKENPEREVIDGIDNNSSAIFRYIDFGKGVRKMTVRARALKGGNIAMKTTSWQPMASVTIPKGNGEWVEVSCDVAGVAGVQQVLLNFTALDNGGLVTMTEMSNSSNPEAPQEFIPGDNSVLMQLDWIRFE